MQNPAADVTVMINLVDANKQFLQEFISDESFEALSKSAEEIALKLDTNQVQVGQKRRLFDKGDTEWRSKIPNRIFNSIKDVAAATLNEGVEMPDSYNEVFGF
jgi:hypothetical protein